MHVWHNQGPRLVYVWYALSIFNGIDHMRGGLTYVPAYNGFNMLWFGCDESGMRVSSILPLVHHAWCFWVDYRYLRQARGSAPHIGHMYLLQSRQRRFVDGPLHASGHQVDNMYDVNTNSCCDVHQIRMCLKMMHVYGWMHIILTMIESKTVKFQQATCYTTSCCKGHACHAHAGNAQHFLTLCCKH